MFVEALSIQTCCDVIELYKQIKPTLASAIRFNLTFPIRKCWRDIPIDLICLLKIELKCLLDHNLIKICGEGGVIDVKDNFR